MLAAGLAVIALLIWAFVAQRGASSRAASGLAIGAPAPQIALPATRGGTFSLAAFKGSKVVVYFYEGSG
ncbi:MAG: redoxin domain-containing protein [bacterium]|nr:redoxin domain-containing protein [bacterium]